MIIADPKGVDFVWAGRLPGVRYYPGESCLDGIREAIGEMRERQSWLQRNLWPGKAGADEEGDLLKVPLQPYKPCLVILDEAAEATGLGSKEEQAETKANMSSLSRLSRFAGMMCAYGTQRPDVGFIAGEAKANLGTRLMYGGGGATLCNMVLEKAQKDLRKLTATCRGRARAVIAEGDAIEFQCGFVASASVKQLRGGVLPGNRLTPMRFTGEPEWREGVQEDELADRVKAHPEQATPNPAIPQGPEQPAGSTQARPAGSPAPDSGTPGRPRARGDQHRQQPTGQPRRKTRQPGSQHRGTGD